MYLKQRLETAVCRVCMFFSHLPRVCSRSEHNRFIRCSQSTISLQLKFTMYECVMHILRYNLTNDLTYES